VPVSPLQEDDLFFAESVRPGEQGGEGVDERADKRAVLRERFCGDQNKPGVDPSGGLVLRVQRHEVLDIGGDERAAGSGRLGQNLIVQKGRQHWVSDDRDGVVSAGSKLFAEAVREHLIQQQWVGHVLTRQQLALAKPGLLGGFLGSGGGGYLGVDFGRVRGPVADGDAHQPERRAGVRSDEDDNLLLT
jgi:hypothetical protein